MRWLFISAPLVGFSHGVWVRWLPETDSVALPVTDATTVFPYTILGLLGIGLLVFFVPIPAQIHRPYWLLTPLEALVCIAAIVGLTVVRFSSDALEPLSAGIAITILLALLTLSWFYHNVSAPVPRWNMPLNPDRAIVMRWLGMVFLFFMLANIGYELPGDSPNTIQAVIVLGIVLLFGIVWPPLVSVYISTQALIELGREEY